MKQRRIQIPIRSSHPFTHFAQWTATMTGRPQAFIIAVLVILTWLITGPLFHWSDTWQLVINTGTTIVTFLMVFLIQNTQNRESTAVQIKLDELIRSDSDAHNALLDLENLTEEELVAMKNRYERLAEEAREALRRGGGDTGMPELPK